ncbi:MAG: 16S rRNA (uracil(1498)-N(3))-methyltransferase [Bacteroidetes bacterium]|nr:16S rRNA (uracil(1498)-N(3))-methyltransferase [Bacteroidota bacterium]
MYLFYIPHIDSSILPCESNLDPEESYHCIKVLRMRTGSALKLTDGQGNLFDAVVVTDDPKRCTVEVQSVTRQEKKGFYLHLAVAPTKNIDRFEWFIEKATEIGVDEITPLIGEFSERTKVRTDRLQKILVSAMKQSMNLYLPILNEPVRFKEVLMKRFEGQKFIGYVEEQQDLLLRDAYTEGSDAMILIGPEGDFSKKEVALAIDSGFTAISLGNSRLRTETAGVVACMTINLLNQ